MPLPALRQLLSSEKVEGLYCLRADAHFTENLPEWEEYIQYLTGFTGSAGLVVITADLAVLFVDGRYTLQAPQEVDTNIWTIERLETKDEWLKANLADKTIGYDPMRLGVEAIEKLEKIFKPKALSQSPLSIWLHRPQVKASPIVPHALEYTGEATTSKLARIGAAIAEKGAEIGLITMLDSVAWALNMRGADVPYCPLFYGALLVAVDGTAMLYALTPPQDLPQGVEVKSYGSLEGDLKTLHKTHKSILLDKAKTNAAWVNAVRASKMEIVWGEDPVIAMKAIKNATELANLRLAHAKDAAAFKAFYQWFSRQAPKGMLTELDVVEALAGFRKDAGMLGLSFPTIAGAGANGAIVHYRATEKTNAKLEIGSLLLLDSGAQYLEGTTDITRTYAIGRPSKQMIEHCTLVLKAHIGLSMVRFPVGTNGVQLDAITRAPLWEQGLDFDHGTGHGVGSYLCVHEGPASISKRGTVALAPGMVLTNEPGLYLEGQYGVRIENMMVVQNHPAEGAAQRDMLGFETLTRVPYDTALIDFTMLTSDERLWLVEYLDVKL